MFNLLAQQTNPWTWHDVTMGVGPRVLFRETTKQSGWRVRVRFRKNAAWARSAGRVLRKGSPETFETEEEALASMYSTDGEIS